MDAQKIRCPKCKGENCVKRGLSQTQNRGKQQRYLCKGCKKTFIPDFGFWKKKNSEEKITAGIDLYFSSLSSRKVRNHFRRHWEKNASHVSVLNWCREYALRVQKYTDTLNPSLGERFYADETEIDCEGRKDIFWANVDWETRMISGFHYSSTREVSEAIAFLKKATAKKQPRFIQTDAAKFYPRAMRKLFSRHVMGYTLKDAQLRKVQHRVNNVSKTKKHNVRIETVFMKVRDRVNAFRGLKALWSAPILMVGIVLQHNYIEAHTTTGKIPAELAGISPEVGKNRWLGLIKMSSRS